MTKSNINSKIFWGLSPQTPTGDGHSPQTLRLYTHFSPWDAPIFANKLPPLFTNLGDFRINLRHIFWFFSIDDFFSFLQRVSIACYAERCISYDRFCLTVWPSVTRWYHAKTIWFVLVVDYFNNIGNLLQFLLMEFLHWRFFLKRHALYKSKSYLLAYLLIVRTN